MITPFPHPTKVNEQVLTQTHWCFSTLAAQIKFWESFQSTPYFQLFMVSAVGNVCCKWGVWSTLFPIKLSSKRDKNGVRINKYGETIMQNELTDVGGAFIKFLMNWAVTILQKTLLVGVGRGSNMARMWCSHSCFWRPRWCRYKMVVPCCCAQKWHSFFCKKGKVCRKM